MSPEQARGDKVIDERADVYALGAILYELLSQQRPHPGDSQNAILHHIATQPAVPLDAERERLPATLVDIIAGALASEPSARPRTAAALATALAPFAAREVWPAPPVPPPADSPAPTTPPARARLRRALLVALALVSIAVGAGALLRGQTTGAAATAPATSTSVDPSPGLPAPPPPVSAPARAAAAPPVTGVAAPAPDARPQPVGRLTGRPSAGIRRPIVVPPDAKTPAPANSVPAGSPKRAAAVPAFDDREPLRVMAPAVHLGLRP